MSAARLIRSDTMALRCERFAAGLCVMLVVARPAFPSEDAAEGSGLVVVLLWGIAALLWSAAVLLRRQLRWVAGPTDYCVAVLAATVLLSMSRADAPRPAANMTSEWIGLIVAYLLIRQLFADLAWLKTLIVAGISTALTLAAYGIYQAFWGLDVTRELYKSDPVGTLESLGIRPNSIDQQVFENRLRSHEPFATFALANSLAGFLVVWSPIAWYWLIARWRSVTEQAHVSMDHRRARAGKHATRSPHDSATIAPIVDNLFVVVMVIGLLLMLLCLIMTQSRTAYVGFAVQMLLVGGWYGSEFAARVRASSGRRWFVAASLGALVVIGAGIVWAGRHGKIDTKLFSESGKSLGYRWQYWQATARLIRDHGWLGVGPGNFRGHYLGYKLAESSEEISDPHNWFLEIWATSGVVAAAALTLAVLIAMQQMARSRLRVIASGHAASGRERGRADWRILVPAGPTAFALACLLSGGETSFFAALAMIWSVFACALAWASPASSPPTLVIGASIAGMMIHLLGAGGISMPGVSQSLWVVLAAGLNLSQIESAESNGSAGLPVPAVTRRHTSRPVVVFGVTSAVVAALVVFVVFVIRPVTTSRAEFALGRETLARHDATQAERHFRAAARADGLWAEPWEALSRIQFEQWHRLRSRSSQSELAASAFEDAVKLMRHAIQLSPQTVEPYQALAEMYAYRAAEEPRFWSDAIQTYRQASFLYPTSAAQRVPLALALWKAGRTGESVTEMKQALELDRLTPHLDKKLPERDRTLFEKRVAGQQVEAE